MKGTFNLEGNGCSFCQFPVKILNIGQELRKCPFLSLKHKGREKKKEQWGINLALTLKHKVSEFLIMENKLVLATWT